MVKSGTTVHISSKEAEVIDCPACGKKIDSEPTNSYKSYKLYHCHACDLKFWHPLKNPGPEWYEKALDISPFRPVWLTHWSQKQFFKDMPASGGKLLEIGCGLGDFLFVAHKAGYAVTGIDFSPKLVEVARQRFGFEDIYPMTLEQFVAEKPDNKYDIITFFEVLEHLDNVTDSLHLVKRLLKPGGFVVCSVPNRDKWRFASISEECDYPPTHLTHWSPQALAKLFDSCGFSVLAVRTQPLISYDHGWFYLVSTKLGIHKLGTIVARSLVAKKANKKAGTEQASTLGATSSTVVKMGVGFYAKVLLPLLGLVTFPVWGLLRRQGSVIYVLATTKEKE